MHSTTTYTFTSRQSSPLLAQLETDNFTSLDTGGNKEISPGALPSPVPDPPIPHSGQVPSIPTSDRGGNTISDSEAGGGHPQTGIICELHIPGGRSYLPAINLKPVLHMEMP